MTNFNDVVVPITAALDVLGDYKDDVFTKLALSMIQDRIDSVNEESIYKNIE